MHPTYFMPGMLPVRPWLPPNTGLRREQGWEEGPEEDPHSPGKANHLWPQYAFSQAGPGLQTQGDPRTLIAWLPGTARPKGV